MANESVFEKKGRIRKPRVHIKYEVYRGNAIELKELPFVVGVLSDLSGKPEEPLKALKDRGFVEIDKDNFDEVLARMKPRLDFRVRDTSKDDESQLRVELKFKTIDDFRPESVVEQVEPLKELLKLRTNLQTLRDQADSNVLEERLQALLDNLEGVRAKLKEALPPDAPPAGKAGSANEKDREGGDAS